MENLCIILGMIITGSGVLFSGYLIFSSWKKNGQPN